MYKYQNIFIGLMTGTSLDGIDTAICSFDYIDGKFFFEEIFFETFPYPDRIAELIRETISDTRRLYDLSQLNFALSKIYADAVNLSLEKSGISKNDITAIGLHGQTLWHQPKIKPFMGMAVSSTFQAGNISALNQFTGIPVIGDFRSADIALGGQGAPLVPVFDYEFLRNENENIIALNIGGISNITVLPKKCSRNDVIAFDTGPGNILIDIAAKKYFGLNYDKDGLAAREGLPDIQKLNELLSIPYIGKTFPKSTGRELFNFLMFDKHFSGTDNPYNVISTLTHFSAKSIAANIDALIFVPDKLIVSGGGARNIFLMELLQNYLPECDILSSEKVGIGIDSKEAVCFAFLAYLHNLRLPGNIPSATGAKSEAVLGVRAG